MNVKVVFKDPGECNNCMLSTDVGESSLYPIYHCIALGYECPQKGVLVDCPLVPTDEEVTVC